MTCTSDRAEDTLKKEIRVEAFKEAIIAVKRVGYGFPVTQRGWHEFDTAIKAMEKLIAKEVQYDDCPS